MAIVPWSSNNGAIHNADVTRLFGFLIFCFVLFVPPAEADSLYTRNLDCSSRFSARAMEICRALERELEWVWTGHAIISPSYRVTFASSVRIFCALPITADDTHSLVAVAVLVERTSPGTFADGQLANGSRFLLNLLGQLALDKFPQRDSGWDDRARVIAENLRKEIALNIGDPGMIWNPQNPHYLLRDGCK